MAGEKEKSTRPPHNHYERRGVRRSAPARGNTACAAQFFPAHVPSRWEQRGFMAMKDHTDNVPVHERLEQGLEWLKNKFRVVFCARNEISDPDDMECLGVTQAVISDFTVDSWIYSIFSGVAELPYIKYPFDSKQMSADRSGEVKERFDTAVKKYYAYFYELKRYMKKMVENDAYFLNSQLRSHTIWFLEKFFSQDLVPPELDEDTKVELEVLMPPPLPKEVADALSDK